MPASSAAHGLPPLYYLAIIALIVVRFLMRELREQKLTLSRIFLTPGFVVAIAVLLVGATALRYPHALPLLAIASLAMLVLGFGVGYGVSHYSTVRIGDPAGVAFVLGSRQTVAIWVAALLARFGARYAIAGSGNDAGAQAALNAALVVLVATALLYRRYRVLLDAKALQRTSSTQPVHVA